MKLHMKLLSVLLVILVSTAGILFAADTTRDETVIWNFVKGFKTSMVGSATYDPASLLDGAGATTTVTVTGASLGDYAAVSFSLDLQGIILNGTISAANVCTARFQNETTGTLDLASGTLRCMVMFK